MKTRLQFVLCASVFLASQGDLQAQSWKLTGNSGTNPSTNFLGTTDNKALVLRTNNKERLRIISSGNSAGYVGIGISAPLQKLDVNGNINIALNTALYIGNKRMISNNGTGNFFAGENSGLFSTGLYNTASGYQSLYLNQGNRNTANGNQSLYFNVEGVENTANGYQSLYSNTNGNFNSANGSYALTLNNSGYANTANGWGAMFNNTIGYSNTANGFGALYNNISGNANTANGLDALGSNNTGSYNTAFGASALFLNSGSTRNTGIGTFAGSAVANGNYNTFIGAYSDANTDGYTNSAALGDAAIITASNQIRIGDIGVETIGGQVGWTIFSDGRFKKNLKDNVPGLAFINKLKPVTYNLDLTGLNSYLHKNTNHPIMDLKDQKYSNQDFAAKEKILHTGFIAQEVEKVAKELGYNFSGVDAPKNQNDLYGLRYDEFVVPLVKAVQELSAQNDSLKSRLDKIEQMLAVKQQTSASNTNAVVTLSSAQLEQNIPNPFVNTTSIYYNIPASFKSAQIFITDYSGKTIKQVQLNTGGAGTVNITASALSSGTYNYSLMVDGKTILSKKMVVAK